MWFTKFCCGTTSTGDAECSGSPVERQTNEKSRMWCCLM